MLEPGMWVLRDKSELVLKSRWVIPRRLQDAGFSFSYDNLDPAIDDLIVAGRAS